MDNFINLIFSILVLSLFIPIEIIGLILLITLPCALLSGLFITFLAHFKVVVLFFLGIIAIYAFYIFVEIIKYEYEK